MLSIAPTTTVSSNLMVFEGIKNVNGDPDNSALTGSAGGKAIKEMLAARLITTATFFCFLCSVSWSHSLSNQRQL